MKRGRWLFLASWAVAALTVLSGATQLFVPELVLRVVGAEATATSAHLFAIVGMFMVLFGGMLLHALRSGGPQPVVVLWAGLQKLGAALAVGLGVAEGVFSEPALAVAGFDLLSGAVILAYGRSVRGAAAAPAWIEVPPLPAREAEGRAR